MKVVTVRSVCLSGGMGGEGVGGGSMPPAQGRWRVWVMEGGTKSIKRLASHTRHLLSSTDRWDETISDHSQENVRVSLQTQAQPGDCSKVIVDTGTARRL